MKQKRASITTVIKSIGIALFFTINTADLMGIVTLNQQRATVLKNELEGSLRIVRGLEGQERYRAFTQVYERIGAQPSLRQFFPRWVQNTLREYQQVRNAYLGTESKAIVTTLPSLAKSPPTLRPVSALPRKKQTSSFTPGRSVQQAANIKGTYTREKIDSYVQTIIKAADSIKKDVLVWNTIEPGKGIMNSEQWWKMAREADLNQLARAVAHHSHFAQYYIPRITQGIVSADDADEVRQYLKKYRGKVNTFEQDMRNELSFWQLYYFIKVKKVLPDAYTYSDVDKKNFNNASVFLFTMAFNMTKKHRLRTEIEKTIRTLQSELVRPQTEQQKQLNVYARYVITNKDALLDYSWKDPKNKERFSTLVGNLEQLQRDYNQVGQHLAVAQKRIANIGLGSRGGAKTFRQGIKSKRPQSSGWRKWLATALIGGALAATAFTAYKVWERKKDGASFKDAAQGGVQDTLKDALTGLTTLRELFQAGVKKTWKFVRPSDDEKS